MKKNKAMKVSKINTGKLLLLLLYAGLLVRPIINMFLYITRGSIQAAVASPMFKSMILNSLNVAGMATMITLVIAYALAMSIERTTIKLKGVFSIFLILPMLIPSISHGMGLIILFGNNGILTNLLKIDGSIYGKWGIIIGSTIYAFPIAFLMFVNVLKYEDSAPYEAANVLGIPKWRQAVAISFPYLRRPFISIVFAVFTMIVTDYGVPIIVGGKYVTVPVVLYQEVIGQLNFAKGSVYGSLLLIPAGIAFLFDLLNSDKNRSSFLAKEFELRKNIIRDSLGYTMCGITSFLILLPIFSFAVLAFTRKYPRDLSATFDNVLNTLNLNGGAYLLNSIIIASFVALIGTSIAFVTAYLTARMRTNFSKMLHLVAITSSAVPGIVLGLSYVLVFKGSFVYGGLAILIMVNLIHFIASPYLMIYDSLNKLNENLEAVAFTLGIPRIRTIKDIIIPQSKETILEMLAYFFVNSMMTISAVSFLATTANKPVSLMINQFEAQMQLENAAVVSIMILLTNVLAKAIIYLVKRWLSQNSIQSE